MLAWYDLHFDVSAVGSVLIVGGNETPYGYVTFDLDTGKFKGYSVSKRPSTWRLVGVLQFLKLESSAKQCMSREELK